MWVGGVWMPLLPLIASALLLLWFYMEMALMFGLCHPRESSFRLVKGALAFKTVGIPPPPRHPHAVQVLLLTMFLAMVPVTWQLIFWPTGSCGPFQHFGEAYCVLSNAVHSLPAGPRTFFLFVGTVIAYVALVLSDAARPASASPRCCCCCSLRTCSGLPAAPATHADARQVPRPVPPAGDCAAVGLAAV